MNLMRSISLLLVSVIACIPLQAQGLSDMGDNIRLVRSEFLPMRDGTRLSTDLYFPKDAKGKLPVILVRSPYSKREAWPYREDIPTLVDAGFVVAFQDMRGRYESEGRYTPSNNSREDGYDTI